MPTDYPVIFLAFAQASQTAPLELKAERKGIRSALEALHDKRFVELHEEAGAEVADLFHAFTRFAGRLAIFHYAGHAGQNLLELEDTPAHAQGLSKLFGEAKNSLHLVFLNGCSTLGQVKLLQEAGIRAVVATSRPIGDELAQKFAVEFYLQLANHRTLEQAFQRAASLLQTLQPGFDCQIQRGISQFSKEQQTALPWGLFVREGDEAALAWTLPKVVVAAPPEARRDVTFDESLARIVEEMAKHNPDIAAASPGVRRSKAKALVLENFPWLISAHLQVLIAGRNNVKIHGMPRLRQLVETYVAVTRLMSFTLLSQVWDELTEKGSLKNLDDFFPNLPTGENLETFDYLHLLRICHALLEANGVKPFIAGLGSSAARTEAGGESFEMYRFFESLRSRLARGEVSDQEAAALSREAEAGLVELFLRVAYLAGYKLLTIPNIRVNFPKRLARRFVHQHFQLYTANIGFTMVDEKDFSNFTHSQSILLFPHPEAEINDINPSETLDLSPFFMDKATWLGAQSPEIYAFACRQPDGSIRYRSLDFDPSDPTANQADWEIVVDERAAAYRVLFEQFHHFLKDFSMV